MRLGFIVVAVLAAASSAAHAQTRAVTIDDLYDPQKRIDLSGGAPTGLTWMSDTHYLWPRPASGGVEWVTVDAATGAVTPLFEGKAVSDRAAEALGLDSAVVGRALAGRGLEMNAARSAAVAAIDNDLYYLPFGAQDRAQRLTSTAEAEEEFTFSPNGELVSFIRNHDLYVVDVDHRRERRLTTGGGPQLLNGKLDWVYQEEIYGRGNYRAYWWSPNSRHLAFLQLDEQPVPEFTVVDHIPRRLTVETWDYPKPGDPNPGVKLAVVNVAGSTPAWVNLDRYAPAQHLVVNVSWMPDSSRVVYQVQDREQTWLDLNTAALDGGDVKTLFRETTKAWVNDNGAPAWLKDGSFVWVSERTGWKHLYHYTAEGALIRPITAGEWDARAFHGVDEANGLVYFSGTERSYIGGDVFRIKLDGTGLTRLSQAAGTHGASFSSAWTSYKQLGVQELADIEDGLAWLRKQPWANGVFGLDGWSYGGFMTTYALTHSTSFAMGIGGGNVTDWRLYDSIYTERLMLMPQNNPEGYDKTSVLKAAKDLHGDLLLLHGVIDDNVHMQNTLALTYELQKAGKPFRLMLYEKSRHGVADPLLVKHMRQTMLDFTLETLLKPQPAASTTESGQGRR